MTMFLRKTLRFLFPSIEDREDLIFFISTIVGGVIVSLICIAILYAFVALRG